MAAQAKNKQSAKAAQPTKPAQPGQAARPVQLKSRAQTVKPGRLPVSEFAFDRPGAASPFGDDLTFPVPPERLTYAHPAEHHG